MPELTDEQLAFVESVKQFVISSTKSQECLARTLKALEDQVYKLDRRVSDLLDRMEN